MQLRIRQTALVFLPPYGELWTIRPSHAGSYVARRSVFNLPVLKEFVRLCNLAEIAASFSSWDESSASLFIRQAQLECEQSWHRSLLDERSATEFFGGGREEATVARGLKRVLAVFPVSVSQPLQG